MIVGLQGLFHLEPKQSWSFLPFPKTQGHPENVPLKFEVLSGPKQSLNEKTKWKKAQLLLGVISPKEPATIGMIPKLAVGHMIKKTAAPQRLATEMTLARLRSLCTIFFLLLKSQDRLPRSESAFLHGVLDHLPGIKKA